MAIITNPVFASVVIMLVLCVLHVNVYLAIIIAAVICGLMGGAPLTEIISLFASGISSHGENAIIFIILAAIASAIVASGMSDAMAPRVSKILGQRPWLLLVGLIIIAALCETVITFGATFVFIIIPPLLTVFNRYSVDRRKVATAIMCGLQIGYVCIPIGYGAVFQDMVAGVMSDCGIEITYLEVAVTTWPIFLAKAALIVGILIDIAVPKRRDLLCLETCAKQQADPDIIRVTEMLKHERHDLIQFVARKHVCGYRGLLQPLGIPRRRVRLAIQCKGIRDLLIFAALRDVSHQKISLADLIVPGLSELLTKLADLPLRDLRARNRRKTFSDMAEEIQPILLPPVIMGASRLRVFCTVHIDDFGKRELFDWDVCAGGLSRADESCVQYLRFFGDLPLDLFRVRVFQGDAQTRRYLFPIAAFHM